MGNLTAHDCPDCGDRIETTDDSDPLNIDLRCLGCNQAFAGYRTATSLVIDGRQ